MLKSIKLYNFKNHLDIGFDFGHINVIVWPNWSGKTNLMEAIYLLSNTHSYLGFTHDKLLNNHWANFIVSWEIETQVGATKEMKVTYDLSINKTTFIYNLLKTTKPKFLASSNISAVFLSPQEMNIMYLGPSWRREFFDEVCLLRDISFYKVKNDYAKILRNRNKVLKNIKEGISPRNDLNYRNEIFIKTATTYYQYRKQFIDYINSNISEIEDLLKNKYSLSFDYSTKIDFLDIENSIRHYIEKNIDRDIMLGHTYIGPHLDDFVFFVNIDKKKYKTQEFLSRWENKSILIALKFLQINYLCENKTNNILLLLDDIFSELDDEHISLVLAYAKNYETFITAQSLPVFLHNEDNLNIINI